MQNQLYQRKPLKTGFVVLCHNCNLGQAKTTINSIKNNYPESKYCCVVPEYCHNEEIEQIAKLCTTHKAYSTVTSLINMGMENAPCKEWNFIVIAGSWVKMGLDRKCSYFIESPKDILFPIVDRKMNFIDGSINGILMQKQAFQEIGPLATDHPLEICKLFWMMEAQEKGYKFKAILGTAIC